MTRKILYIGVLILMIVAVFTGCASQKSGCYMSRSFSGTH